MPSHFEDASIKILYRDRIRVFYGTVNQANNDGYKDFSEQVFSRKNGFVYSYTGLRGDAKRLYQRVTKGTEKRVKFIKAPTPKDQAEHLKNADLVIWACGYQTNKIPIKDTDGKELSLCQKIPFSTFDCDSKMKLVCQDGAVLTKLFGSGIAYPTRTNDGMIRAEPGKPNPKADSFSLYCNWVANRILMNIIPR